MSERDIFTAAREMTDPVARCAYLDGACGTDTGLRSRVEALLRAHDQPDSLLDHPAVAPHDPDSATTRTIAREGDAVTDEEALTFLAPPGRADSLGRLGHYEVLQVLGQGGFGIVLRAFDEVLHRVVAVKVLSPQLAATSPARKRFLREARSSAQVRHENVVQTYEIGEQPLPYIAMEFIPGETLQQRLNRVGPVEPAEVVRIGRQIAEGLAAAHATDLIHRDIKPGNILLEGGAGRVKITDFGLARAADDASISQSGIIAGTPMYMAPEQAKGDKLDQRADLFSLGSVLYQMAAGRPPFRANSAVAVLKRVADDTPREIRELIPETPQWLCAIIAKLHAKDPDDRYQSAREVADVLADCETQLKANAKLKDYSRIPQSKPAAGRSGRWKWIAAAALLLPVLALALAESAGITHLLHGRKPDDKGPPQNQQATVAPLKPGDPQYTNTLGMKFKLIPAGKFTMGSPKKEIDRCLNLVDSGLEARWLIKFEKARLPTEGPEHEVEITQPFYMGTTEVTVGQFRQFVDEEGYQVGDARWRNPGFEQRDNHPVVMLTWQNAVDFCDWLSKKEGKKYRLPTEAEWEYSCRAGKAGSRYCFGDDEAELENYAWYATNARGGTHPVGKKKPNAWGLYDMHGNTWEWCQDYYDPNYYRKSPVKDPLRPGEGGERVLRGGAWMNSRVDCRSAFRFCLDTRRCNDTSFRVLLVSPPGGAGSDSGTKNKPSAPAIAPFDAAQARAHQAASAKLLGIPVETINSIGLKLRFIPAGKFLMGSSQEEIDFWLKQKHDGWFKELLLGEGPQHEVEITQPFYMGQTDVTMGQFRQFVKTTGYKTQAEREGGAVRGFPNGGFKDVANTDWLNPGFAQTDDHPVVCVSWNDAVEFCQWLSKQEGKTYRLPTEAEWEYSCRAGSKGRWSFGDNESELWDYARVGGNSQHHSWPVAGLKANAWGLYDMHGNVEQWCQDPFDPNYYKTSPPKDSPGPAAGNERVARGGFWLWDDAWWSRSAMRHKHSPAGRANFIGFRVVLVVSSPKTKTPPLAVGPFTDADVQRIAALPAAQQVEEVRKELKRRNPGFDGKMETKIEDGVVTEFRIVTDQVTDIAPIRVWSALRVLDCSGTWTNFKPNGQLEDLTPLKGMNLAALTHLKLSSTKVGDAGMVYFKDCKNLTHLNLFLTQVSDTGMVHFKDRKNLTHLALGWTKVSDAGLANFKDCKNLTELWIHQIQVGDAGMVYFQDCKALKNLNLAGTKVSNVGLAHFKDCKNLKFLYLDRTQVSDAGLTQLKGMPLRELNINDTGITDLTPLQGMPLEHIRLTPKNITRGMDVLRNMKSLETIGLEWKHAWPAAEFWQRYDKGEFK